VKARMQRVVAGPLVALWLVACAANGGLELADTGVEDDAAAGLDASFEPPEDAGERADSGADASTPPGDSGPADAGAILDGGFDAGIDGGLDAGLDAGFDGGLDAGFDGGFDAGFDGGFDAGFDGGFDAGFDGGFDAGFDGGFDAGFDAGAPDSGCTAVTTVVRAAGRGRSVDAPDGDRDWSSPDSVSAADAIVGSISVDNVARARLSNSGERSHYLVADRFGFALPSGARVEGVTVRCLRATREDPSKIADARVALVRGGAIESVSRDAGGWSPRPFGTVTLGGPSDTWGRSWTAAEISDPDFGVAIQARWTGSAGNDDAYVDLVEVEVAYSTCGP